MKIPGVDRAALEVCKLLTGEPPTQLETRFLIEQIIKHTGADLMQELCEKILTKGYTLADLVTLARQIQATLGGK